MSRETIPKTRASVGGPFSRAAEIHAARCARRQKFSTRAR
jgi:hypothetical protein